LGTVGDAKSVLPPVRRFPCPDYRGRLSWEDSMSDAMSFAEFDGQHVELLPARTVLSLFSVGDQGANGSPGTAGSDGQSIPGTTMWNLFGLAQYGYTSNEGCASASNGHGEASYCQ
jgi:hypothetical protein